ncbi:MAG: hypothetical protein IJV45_09330 [Prevotella sp.]|nr:hypothetical protein [Prevotella sp.]
METTTKRFATIIIMMGLIGITSQAEPISPSSVKYFKIEGDSPIENENEPWYPHLAPSSYVNSLSGVYNDSLQSLSLYFGFTSTATNVKIYKNYNLQIDSLISVTEGEDYTFNLSNWNDDGDYVVAVTFDDSSNLYLGQFQISNSQAREFSQGFYRNRTIARQTSNQSIMQYTFDASIRSYIGETFRQSFSFNAGTQHFIRVRSNTLCEIRMFYENNPDTFSIFRTTSWINSTISQDFYTFTPAISGTYHLLVTTVNEETGKTANIIVDNGFNVISPVSHNYYAYPSLNNSEQPYNIFVTSKYWDPQLYVIGNSGEVIAYNDDYSSNNSFNWGKTARFIGDNTHDVIGVIATSDYVTTDYGIRNMIDVYAGCPIVHDNTNLKMYYDNYFDNFDDIMISGPSSLEYDHIAWAADEINYDNPYLKLFQFNTGSPDKPLAPIDAFLRSKLYTREDATESNSDIDLYITPEDSICVYATVKAYGTSSALGYAWESKVGTSERIFHPRYALKNYAEDGDSLIILHYRRWSIFELKDMDELGIGYIDFVYKNVELTNDEIATIRQKTTGLKRRQINSFQTLYDQCKTVINNPNFDCMTGLSNSSAYNSLRSLCQQTPELMNFVYINANNGDHLAFKLIDDVAVPLHYDLVQSVKNYNDSVNIDENNKKIRYSIQANTILFIKAILDSANAQTTLLAPKGISNSNDSDIFSVTADNRFIRVDISLDYDASVSLAISTPYGRAAIMRVNREILREGQHHFDIPVRHSGVYTVTYYINGRMYEKKISIK